MQCLGKKEAGDQWFFGGRGAVLKTFGRCFCQLLSSQHTTLWGCMLAHFLLWNGKRSPSWFSENANFAVLFFFYISCGVERKLLEGSVLYFLKFMTSFLVFCFCVAVWCQIASSLWDFCSASRLISSLSEDDYNGVMYWSINVDLIYIILILIYYINIWHI